MHMLLIYNSIIHFMNIYYIYIVTYTYPRWCRAKSPTKISKGGPVTCILAARQNQHRACIAHLQRDAGHSCHIAVGCRCIPTLSKAFPLPEASPKKMKNIKSLWSIHQVSRLKHLQSRNVFQDDLRNVIKSLSIGDVPSPCLISEE